MAIQFTAGRFSATATGTALPLIGGQLFTYAAGTSTPQATYTDSTLGTPNTNPVILNTRGEANVWLGSSAYKFILQDSLGNTIWTDDGVVDPGAAPAANIAALIVSLAASAGSSLIGWIQQGAGAVLRTIQSKLREEVSADDFGADPSGSLDSYAAITAALTASPNVKLSKNGNYKSSQQIIFPANTMLRGYGRSNTTLTVTGNVAAVQLNANCRLSSLAVRQAFAGTHTANLVEVGSVAVNARCATLDNLDVSGAGQDNIAIIHGNLGSIGNISSTSAGRDNLSFSSSTIDCNAWRSFGYIDLNAAIRDNLHISGGSSLGDAFASRTHILTFAAQSAGRYNAYVGSRSNLLCGYVEAAAIADVFFDTFGQGNELRCPESSVIIDNAATANSNLIYNGNMGAAYVRGFTSKVNGSGVTGKGFALKNDDGTAGESYWEKRGARNFVFAVATSGATQSTSFINDAGGANQHVVIFGGNIYPSATNSFTCGQSGNSWSGGFTQVAFTVTSDENTKTLIRTRQDKELVVARGLLEMDRVYKLRTSVAEKGEDAARWHSGMIAQQVCQLFTDQGLDPYDYAMNCRDAVMEGIGEPILNADGSPVMEADSDGKLFPAVDRVGRQKVVDGQPQWLLSLRYEELYAWALGAVGEELKRLQALCDQMQLDATQRDAQLQELFARVLKLESATGAAA